MERPAKCASRQGLLLVEAVLAATVMAVGLVFISRGLASQLRALSAAETYDILAALAGGKLRELEQLQLFAAPGAEVPRDGDFPPPHAAYRWTATVAPRETDADEPASSVIRLTVRHGSAAFSLTAVWPTDHVPAAWL